MRNVVLRCLNLKRYMNFYIRLSLTIFSIIFVLSIYNYASPSSSNELKNKLTLLNNEYLLKYKENEKRLLSALKTDAENGTMASLDVVHLAVVACGDRLEEPLMMLKSAVMFGNHTLHFHIFADDSLRQKFNESLIQWQTVITRRVVNFTLYPIQFPKQNAEEWRKLFKLCACQRLFIPELLKNVDSLIYVDTDVLFLRPVSAIWLHFSRFNTSHIAALAPETEDASTNWYVRFSRHPFYKPLGLNSGVMLMNLTRMRQFNWQQYLYPTLNTYRYNITWGDQDIINIIFSQHPDKLYIYGCEWNYRPDHCMYMSTCKSAEKDGVSILHGSRGYFHLDKQPIFRTIYNAMKSYNLGSDVRENLIEPLKSKLQEYADTNCGKVYPIFLKQLEASSSLVV